MSYLEPTEFVTKMVESGESLLVNCFLRPGFLEAEGPGKVGVQSVS